MTKKDRITERWENGVPHDPRSEALFHSIAKLDFEECGDYFCWKYGGDGDNGETLMYQLDLHFSDLDANTKERGPAPEVRALLDLEAAARWLAQHQRVTRIDNALAALDSIRADPPAVVALGVDALHAEINRLRAELKTAVTAKAKYETIVNPAHVAVAAMAQRDTAIEERDEARKELARELNKTRNATTACSGRWDTCWCTTCITRRDAKEAAGHE